MLILDLMLTSLQQLMTKREVTTTHQIRLMDSSTTLTSWPLHTKKKTLCYQWEQISLSKMLVKPSKTSKNCSNGLTKTNAIPRLHTKCQLQANISKLSTSKNTVIPYSKMISFLSSTKKNKLSVVSSLQGKLTKSKSVMDQPCSILIKNNLLKLYLDLTSMRNKYPIF